ncbi:uncharacterized protein DS421_14g467430 [Arachis hypogaea]|nr:uncharacterized protein DS421_14g467430 [Arachis hypogaea]
MLEDYTNARQEKEQEPHKLRVRSSYWLKYFFNWNPDNTSLYLSNSLPTNSLSLLCSSFFAFNILFDFLFSIFFVFSFHHYFLLILIGYFLFWFLLLFHGCSFLFYVLLCVLLFSFQLLLK